MIQIRVVDVNGQGSTEEIDAFPNLCPNCHKGLAPEYIHGHERGSALLWLMLRCPLCQVVFTARYARDESFDSYKLEETVFLTPVNIPKFSNGIRELSPKFCDIYFESVVADGNELRLIAGPGYRKALEFLIKDYLIKKQFTDDRDQQEHVKAIQLGSAIQLLKDDKLKEAAARAAWLGNDETHYVRKWEDKDLESLKKIIGISLRWVENHLDHEELMRDMPSGKRL